MIYQFFAAKTAIFLLNPSVNELYFIRISKVCNSLKSNEKKANFLTELEHHNPDIIIGCESKLDNEHANYSIFPKSYEIKRKDKRVANDFVVINIQKYVPDGWFQLSLQAEI